MKTVRLKPLLILQPWIGNGEYSILLSLAVLFDVWSHVKMERSVCNDNKLFHLQEKGIYLSSRGKWDSLTLKNLY